MQIKWKEGEGKMRELFNAYVIDCSEGKAGKSESPERKEQKERQRQSKLERGTRRLSGARENLITLT